MTSWRTRLASLWRGKAAPPATARAGAKKKAPGGQRAQLIAAAMALHRDRGAPLRADLQRTLDALKDRRTLRDPDALARLLALAQAQQAMHRLFSGDLRRYLAVAGVRQLLAPDGAADAPRTGAKKTAVTVRR